MDLVDGSLRALGAFYVFAGVVGARAALTGDVMDRMLAAIEAATESEAKDARKSDAPDDRGRAKAAWLLLGAFAVLVSGVLLLLKLHLAQWAFLLSALLQALYLFYLAPAHFDAIDPPDAQGRRQTTNAFVLYAAVTAYVMWAGWLGRLLPLEAVDPWLIGAAVVPMLGFLAHALWTFTRPLMPR